MDRSSRIQFSGPGSKKPAIVLLNNIDPDWPQTEIELVKTTTRSLQNDLRSAGHKVQILIISDSDLEKKLIKYPPDNWIIFNWCEELPGLPHSDVNVARILETLNYTFTGSTSDVLALSWDKAQVKHILESYNIPTPAWTLANSAEGVDWNCFPAIVKPAREHCSTGITEDSVVLSREDLSKRIQYVVREFGQPALIEDFIDGREFHVTVWGNSDMSALPVAEMDFTGFNNIRDRLCTYESKFTPGSRHYEMIKLILPAPLSEDQLAVLEDICCRTCQAIGIRDYARVDVRLRQGIFYVLDVNPNADISPDTSPVCAAEFKGYSHADFCRQLVYFAAQRHPRYVTKSDS